MLSLSTCIEITTIWCRLPDFNGSWRGRTNIYWTILNLEMNILNLMSRAIFNSAEVDSEAPRRSEQAEPPQVDSEETRRSEPAKPRHFDSVVID